MLLLLVACAPEAGTYLLETSSWSTTCALAGGPYEEPAAQYEVQVYVEPEGVLWLDDVECARVEFEYACAGGADDKPAGLEATFRVERVWTGSWTDPVQMTGQVDWTMSCVGEGCSAVTVELCDASWAYAAVNVGESS